MFVKICGITTEADALLAVAVGADAIGFVFAPSKRQVGVRHVAEIVSRVPREILTVGVFRNETPQRVISICAQAGLGAAQLHGHESPTDVKAVKREVRTVFKAVAAGTKAFEHADQFGADAILVDSSTPGSGKVFDWGLAEDGPGTVQLILAGGLTPANVAAAVAKVNPWGVDVSTGVESAPGVKDPALVRAFVSEARRAQPEAFVSPQPIGHEPYDWQEDPTWR